MADAHAVVTCVCGKQYDPKDRGWDAARRRCRNRSSCMARAAAGVPSLKPYVGGFDPAAAYQNAPKLGDA